LGHGQFGRTSRRLRRDDPRLRDEEGSPFWEATYAATVTQVQSRIRAGAWATIAEEPDGFDLKVCSGRTVWEHAIDPETLFFRENSRCDGGKPVQSTHNIDFRCNVGLERGLFGF